MSNPHQITREFEKAVASYTGAKYCVAVNSCTSALMLACAWHLRDGSPMTSEMVKALQHPSGLHIEIPKRTYVSVPQAIIHAAARLAFRDEEWSGAYQLKPFPVWDSARRFTSDMYRPGQFQCVSFHASKILGDTQGGAIIHDDEQADAWFRRARFDGRTEGVEPKNDHFDMIGYHCYMSPDVAARLLLKLSVLPEHNEDLPNSDYPDLSTFEVFK